MRRRPVALALTAGATLAGALIAAAPASATCSVSSLNCTTAQVVINPGSLAVGSGTAGTTVTLTGSGAILPLSTVSHSLGTTTVTDTRGNSTGWTASVTATDFSDGTHSFPASTASMSATGTGGGVLPVTCGGSLGVLAVSPLVALTEGSGASAGSASGTLATCVAANVGVFIGSNTSKWDETFSVTLPQNVVPGTYSSDVTQSVQ